MLLQPALSSVGLEDREESGPTLLEVQPTTDPTMCILSMADLSTSTSSSSGFHRGVHAQEIARDVSSQECDTGWNKRICSQGDLQGLGQGPSPRAEATGQLHQEGNEPPLQQSIPIFDDLRAGHPNNAGAGRTEQQPPSSCSRRVPGVPELAPHKRGDRGQLVDPNMSMSEQVLRAGLLRHIYGCLKRSENCWLEIHRLFCETSETEDDRQLQTTYKVMRTILQNKQPGMKHLSEMYLLQPKQLKTVAEVCNPNRFGPTTDHFGLRAGQAFDLELGWDLLDSGHQRTVISYLKTENLVLW